MYVKVEPSGCCGHKGMVQVRFSMYLDPDDYGYALQHIEVPILSSSDRYPGEVGEGGLLNKTEFKKWIDEFPKEWRDMPFHNHFVYVPPDTTDNEILDIGEAFLHEAYIKWAMDENRDLNNNDLPFNKQEYDPVAILAKVTHLHSTILERKL